LLRFLIVSAQEVLGLKLEYAAGFGTNGIDTGLHNDVLLPLGYLSWQGIWLQGQKLFALLLSKG